MPRTAMAVNPPELAKPLGFSHGWETQGGRTLYMSGQVAFDGEGRVVGSGDLVAQFRQVCQNLKALVGARGGQMTDIVKLTVYLTDIARLPDYGRIKAAYIPGPQPASTAVGVTALAVPGLVIEVEATAVL